MSAACDGPTKCQMLGQVPEEEERKPGVALCSWGVREGTQVGTIQVLNSAEALVLETGDQLVCREERSMGGPLSSGLDGRSF